MAKDKTSFAISSEIREMFKDLYDEIAAESSDPKVREAEAKIIDILIVQALSDLFKGNHGKGATLAQISKVTGIPKQSCFAIEKKAMAKLKAAAKAAHIGADGGDYAESN